MPFNDEVDGQQQGLAAFNVILSHWNGKTRIV